MSDSERTFLRNLKITLIAGLTPLVITGLVMSGLNIQRINTNEKHIEALEGSRVSRDVFLLYVDEQRKMIELLMVDIGEHCSQTDGEIANINDRLDQIIRDVYEVKKRGFPEDYNFD